MLRSFTCTPHQPDPATRNALRVGVDGFKEAETVQTLFPVNRARCPATPFPSGAFHGAERNLLRCRCFQSDLHARGGCPHRRFTRSFTVLSASLLSGCDCIAIGVTIATQKLFDVIFHFGHFGAVIELARFTLFVSFSSISAECPASYRSPEPRKACTDRLR